MKYFLTISGKADRFEWWTISLIADLLMQIAGIIGFIMLTNSNDLMGHVGGGLLVALSVFFLWLAIAVTFRRLRDRGRPLWCITFYIFPLIGWIWMLIECGFLPSAYTGSKRTLVRKTVVAGHSGISPSQALPSPTDH